MTQENRLTRNLYSSFKLKRLKSSLEKSFFANLSFFLMARQFCKTLVEQIPFLNSDLKSSKIVSETLLECIRTGELEAFREVLAFHIMSTNKLQLSKKT